LNDICQVFLISQVGVGLSEAATDRRWCWLHNTGGSHR